MFAAREQRIFRYKWSYNELPLTPSIANRSLARGERASSALLAASKNMPVPKASGSTVLCGKNLRLCGLGVVSVSMNMLRTAPRPQQAGLGLRLHRWTGLLRRTVLNIAMTLNV